MGEKVINPADDVAAAAQGVEKDGGLFEVKAVEEEIEEVVGAIKLLLVRSVPLVKGLELVRISERCFFRSERVPGVVKIELPGDNARLLRPEVLWP